MTITYTFSPLGANRYQVQDANGSSLCVLAKTSAGTTRAEGNKVVQGWKVEGTNIGKYMPCSSREKAVKRFVIEEIGR